jgi:hypothetical protein
MMMRWMTWWMVSVVVLAAGGVGGAQTAPASTPRDYAILGLDSVSLLPGVNVEAGDVGCNASGGAVTLMARARVASAVAGNTVRLGMRASAGELFCTKVEAIGPSSATCSPMTAPLVDGAALPTVEVNPGTTDIRLAKGGSMVGLAPGPYGAVRLGARSELTLAGGEYDFRRIFLIAGAKLICETACTIRVADAMIIGTGGQLGPRPPLDATAVRVEARGGSKVNAGFRTFKRSTVDANVYAPNGRIILGMGGTYTGAFIGKAVFAYNRAKIVGLSAF